jgi:hypothetical protein
MGFSGKLVELCALLHDQGERISECHLYNDRINIWYHLKMWYFTGIFFRMVRQTAIVQPNGNNFLYHQHTEK